MGSGDWRAALAAARAQREPFSTAQRVWRERWCRWYGIFVRRGKTPGEAISLATRMTTDQLGDQPAPERAP